MKNNPKIYKKKKKRNKIQDKKKTYGKMVKF